jgi:hypothetical protein
MIRFEADQRKFKTIYYILNLHEESDPLIKPTTPLRVAL